MVIFIGNLLCCIFNWIVFFYVENMLENITTEKHDINKNSKKQQKNRKTSQNRPTPINSEGLNDFGKIWHKSVPLH